MKPYRDYVFRHPPDPVRIVVEVGVYQGSWVKRAALYLPKDVIIFAVDSWQGRVAGRSTETSHPIFREFVKEELEEGKIIEIHKPSLEAAKEFCIPIDLLHLDGDHYHLLDDLIAWVPHVRRRGVILCHDFSGHRQSKYVQRDLIKYFGGEVHWRSGAYMGATQRMALKIHSAWIDKQGHYGHQDSRAAV